MANPWGPRKNTTPQYFVITKEMWNRSRYLIIYISIVVTILGFLEIKG